MTAYLRVCLVVVTYLAVAASLPAAVFERDWKMPGDGLLTYDDVNQREWLDLPVSLLSQFPTPRYENAVAETAPGGVFEGFTLAKSPDVIALAESAGIDMSTIEYEVNGETISRLVGLLTLARILRRASITVSGRSQYHTSSCDLSPRSAR